MRLLLEVRVPQLDTDLVATKQVEAHAAGTVIQVLVDRLIRDELLLERLDLRLTVIKPETWVS